MAERLISVPAARSHIDAVVADPILKACMNNVLDSLPAVDAVKVVRCKDCKLFSFCYNYNEQKRHKEDFCSYGERRCDNG